MRRNHRLPCRSAALALAMIAIGTVAGHGQAFAADTWRGLVVAPEHRCAPYDRGDYPYSQSVEAEIVASMGGRIYGPYTGRHYRTLRDTDIEHIVAVSEAHDSGLCAAGPSLRRRFASDLLNLTLAAPEVNRCGTGGKCAFDAGDWLPPMNRCWFAARVVAVKRKYALTVDHREAAALERLLSGCVSPRMVVTIAVTADAPSFGSTTIVGQEYTAGAAIAALTLPAATGGDAPVTYSLSPALPAGLAFDPAARTLSGTPGAAVEATTYTYTATDADGETATLTFSIAVLSEPLAMPTDREVLVALYEAAGGAQWIDSSGWLGAEPLGSWHGVTTDAAGRVTGLNLNNNGLSGSLPSALGSLTGLRSLFLYGNAGLTGALPGSLSALAGLQYFYAFGTGLCLPPALDAWHAAIQRKGTTPACTGGEVPILLTFGSATVSAQEYTAGAAIAALTLPAATGGDAPVTYSLSPALPAGLAFDPAARTLSGTPGAAVEATTYTYTATDADGETASLTFTMAVGSAPSAMPSFGSSMVLGQEYTVDEAIAALTLPAATGGDAPVTYSLSPALPAGLAFDPAARTLSGTPGAAVEATTYTYTATDADGETASLTFTMAVGSAPSAMPSFGSSMVLGQEYTVDEAIAALTLPAATGGDAPVTYSLSPALPAGLAFDPAARTLSGTPGAAVEATTYTYTATDADGETATLTFSIAVLSEPLAMPTDREVLVALYEAAGGAQWIDSSGWLGAEPLGSWHGATTDAAGRVTGLNLNNNGLSGSLPSALGSLTGSALVVPLRQCGSDGYAARVAFRPHGSAIFLRLRDRSVPAAGAGRLACGNPTQGNHAGLCHE